MRLFRALSSHILNISKTDCLVILGTWFQYLVVLMVQNTSPYILSATSFDATCIHCLSSLCIFEKGLFVSSALAQQVFGDKIKISPFQSSPFFRLNKPSSLSHSWQDKFPSPWLGIPSWWSSTEWSIPDDIWDVSVLLVLESPRLGTVLQQWYHKCSIEGENHFPQSADCSFTLLQLGVQFYVSAAEVWKYVAARSLSDKLLPRWVVPHCTFTCVTLSWVKNFAFAFVEFHVVVSGCFRVTLTA